MKKKGYVKNYRKKSFFVYFSLRLIVILILLLNLFDRNYENVFLCVLTLFLFLIPAMIEETFQIDIPSMMEIIIFLFIFAAQILGEINSFYTLFPHWDTVLHTINGFIMGAIGLSLIEILNDSDKVAIDLSPLFVSIVAFCFSMTIGVFWEFFEYGMDSIFKLDMQKDTIITEIHSVTFDEKNLNRVHHLKIEDVIVNGERWDYGGYLDIGLIDTMNDLFVNFIGALVFSIIGYLDGRSKNNNLENWLIKLKKRERKNEKVA